MALNPNALTDVDNQKLYLGITVTTYDTLLELLINAVSEWIENECGRSLVAPGAEIEELHDGDWDSTGRCKIFTKQYPILALSKIEYAQGELGNETWEEFNTNEYTYEAANGVIYVTRALKSLPPNRQNIRVTYRGGFANDNIPQDLQLACLKMVAKEFDKRRSQGITQESVGGGTATWNEEVDPSAVRIFRKYRRFF